MPLEQKLVGIPSYKALLKAYRGLPAEVQSHFEHVPSLVKEFPYDVAIAYVFLKVELAQNRALYGGVVKLHRGHAQFAHRAVNVHHMTRAGFKDLYKNIFGTQLSAASSCKLDQAEAARDRVIHGKAVPDGELRQSIVDCLEYAVLLNREVSKIAGFKPFGDMRGFKGRADSLDKRTTKWLMRGLGFGVKA